MPTLESQILSAGSSFWVGGGCKGLRAVALKGKAWTGENFLAKTMQPSTSSKIYKMRAQCTQDIHFPPLCWHQKRVRCPRVPLSQTCYLVLDPVSIPRNFSWINITIL